ncbi:hypothetical protein CDL12_13337 [Handroanthus impetiginosus]|uniref:BZIP domain-containing protein n=1 Tax=Handroanthus impetiginosus TaxID=429701 RepID=A0A2G9H9R8_9LAMI|nr:hypothetical protein CDL12_13337 [Handroanthus impetiginosus]
MDCSSGISSISSGLQNSASEEELMDQRKRKRMISNRESARRSRLRKRKQLDDLITQASHLMKENQEILIGFNASTQHCLNVEAENAILRTQVAELRCQIQSLNEIVSFLSAGNGGFPAE